MKTTACLLMCSLALVLTISIHGIDLRQIQVFAQPSSDNSSDSQPLPIIAPVPGWIKNNTGLWSNGKLGDAQFILGMRYLVTNNIMPLSSQYIDTSLQKPGPPWFKKVAAWWADGNVTDYDFISDVQYLVLSGEMSLGSGGNKTVVQDTSTLQSNFPKGKIKIDNMTLDVQIADTPDRMTEGLQFQQPLPYNQGMIFVFPQPQLVAMWMKDMQFPLDMIWFDSNGNVIHIEKNLAACSENLPCPVYDAASQNTKYVLEVTAGFVDKFHMTEKSKLVIINQ